MSGRRAQQGITTRHAKGCASREGLRCNCKPTYQAQVFSPRDGKRLTKTFPTLAAAKAWRQDTTVEVRRGARCASNGLTVRVTAERWLRAADAGTIRNRSGDLYKPSVLRGYEQALRIRILPELGAAKLSELRRSDVQRFVDRMLGLGLDPSTIRNTVLPLRVIYRRALTLDEVAVNPTVGLQLPAVRGRRDRIAAPAEAAELIAALPSGDQPLWATAMYAGLRAGELRALDWANVDLVARIIRVEHSWDPRAGLIQPKSRAGQRAVPVAEILRKVLVQHAAASDARGMVFGRTPELPFQPTSVWDRARTAWARAEMRPIRLHECRHTFASLMIAAGVNPKALSTFMGHSTVTITLDRYGHLFPGSEEEAAGLLDAYLARERTAVH